jgi:hypothetical protein
MNKDNSHHLNDSWCLYFHDPKGEDWSRGSYVRIGRVSTIEDYWALENNLRDRLHIGMFFLMRESVFPLWEDKENIKGGYLSIRIERPHVLSSWETICGRILGETFLKPEYAGLFSRINGVSISPKKAFCIMKIWLRDKSVNNPHQFDWNATGTKPEDVQFRSYLEEDSLC